jgi:hypothetical protein
MALFATLLSQFSVVTFYDEAMLLDECSKPIDHIDLTLDDKPLTLRSDASFFVCFKTTLGLVETTFIELLAFLQTSKLDLDVPAARRQQSRASFKIGPELSPRSRCFRLGLLVALERWEERLDVGDSLLLTFDVEFCLGDISVECFEFSLDFTLLTLSSRQAFGSGAESCIVGVQSLGELDLSIPGGNQHPLSLVDSTTRTDKFGTRSRRAVARLLKCGSCSAASICADPPATQSESVTRASNDNSFRMLHCSVKCLGEFVNPHR